MLPNKEKWAPRESYKNCFITEYLTKRWDKDETSMEKGLETSWVYQHKYPVADKRN